MFTAKILRQMLVPAAAIVAETTSKCDYVCKPSELPIYAADGSARPQEVEICQTEPGTIEKTFSAIRKAMTTITDEAKNYQKLGEQYMETGIENAEWLIEYLREEDNTTPKAGAIAVGGLAGLVFGLRGGILKKIIYTSTGALGMAAVCYPNEAAQYSKFALAEAKKYIIIGYNFIYGVKQGDPPLELPSLPKLPSSISEAWGMAKDFRKSSVSDPNAETLGVGGDSSEQVIAVSGTTLDPLCVVSQVHETATATSCHCPIGACLDHHSENNNSPLRHPEPTCPPLVTE